MSQEKKDNRIVINEAEARNELLEGAKLLYDTVTTTYGPKGKNVLAEKPFGRPLLTRDGVTVARETYFADRAKNMGAQILLEASETSNRIAGDGTTGVVALGYHLFRRGVEAIAAGTDPMQLKQQLLNDSYILLTKLEKLSKPTKKSQLKEVATVSAGDPLLGQLIAEAIEYVGPDGGIITEKSHVSEVEREYVDGYYLQAGFQALPVGKKDLITPTVIVTTRRLTSAQDAIEILNKAAEAMGVKPGNIPRFLFIGDIEEQAYNTIVNTLNQGVIDAVILKTPPMFGNMGKALLEDIAIYADCSPITEQTNLSEFNASYLGTVDRVVATKNDATLFSDNKGETIQDRVAEIKELLAVETVDAIAEKYRDRISKLEGKIALFRIGGATDGAKEEKEFRVEDAILATRAAFSHGVVAGGGITLLELSKADISPLYRDALRDVFNQLLINAGLPEQVKLHEALKAPAGQGYNLRKSEELVDMVKEGILDPTLVVREIIKNATEVSANALTVGALLVFEDRED